MCCSCWSGGGGGGGCGGIDGHSREVRPPKRPNTHTHGSTHGYTISNNATRFRLFTYLISHMFLILQETKTLVVGGKYFKPGLPQIPFRMYLADVAHGNCAISIWPLHRLFRRANSTFLSISIAAKYENSGCRGKKCICLHSEMKHALHSNMWLSMRQIMYAWLWC